MYSKWDCTHYTNQWNFNKEKWVMIGCQHPCGIVSLSPMRTSAIRRVALENNEINGSTSVPNNICWCTLSQQTLMFSHERVTIKSHKLKTANMYYQQMEGGGINIGLYFGQSTTKTLQVNQHFFTSHSFPPARDYSHIQV